MALPIHPEVRKWELVSHAIPENDDGYYPFYQRVVLTFTEPLRRHKLRSLRAIAKLNQDSEPWKFQYLYLWTNEFFIPAVLLLKRAYDKFFIPSFISQQVDYPQSLWPPSQFIYDACDTVCSLTKSLYELTNKGKQGSVSVIADKTEKLLKLYPELCIHIGWFLDGLETFQTQVFRAKGEAEYYRLEHKASTYLLTNDRGISTLVTASVYDGWGYEFPGYVRGNGLEDSSWCNEATRVEAMANFSYLFTEYLVNSWNDRYQRYKTMIDCVYEDNNRLAAFDQLHRHSCCTIT